MPNIRVKQMRAGAFGQSSKIYVKCNKNVPGGQGVKKQNPSQGSLSVLQKIKKIKTPNESTC